MRKFKITLMVLILVSSAFAFGGNIPKEMKCLKDKNGEDNISVGIGMSLVAINDEIAHFSTDSFTPFLRCIQNVTLKPVHGLSCSKVLKFEENLDAVGNAVKAASCDCVHLLKNEPQNKGNKDAAKSIDDYINNCKNPRTPSSEVVQLKKVPTEASKKLFVPYKWKFE